MKLGDFVSAQLLHLNDVRQGVYIKDNPDGTILVLCSDGTSYVCEKDATVVPDKNLRLDTLAFVRRVRRDQKL